MGQRHKQRLESCLSCAVTESAPVGAAQPEYSGQPKGWYSESKMKVGLCLGLWVRCLGLWVIGKMGYRGYRVYWKKRLR
jgi:hypothetical protein